MKESAKGLKGPKVTQGPGGIPLPGRFRPLGPLRPLCPFMFRSHLSSPLSYARTS